MPSKIRSTGGCADCGQARHSSFHRCFAYFSAKREILYKSKFLGSSSVLITSHAWGFFTSSSRITSGFQAKAIVRANTKCDRYQLWTHKMQLRIIYNRDMNRKRWKLFYENAIHANIAGYGIDRRFYNYWKV